MAKTCRSNRSNSCGRSKTELSVATRLPGVIPMSIQNRFGLSLAGVGGGMGWFARPPVGQSGAGAAPQAGSAGSTSADPQREAARRQILESERWQRARHDLNRWLSIQRVYTPQE